MENANVLFFTDNNQGKELASAIESLGLSVRLVLSVNDRQILKNYRENYILIFYMEQIKPEDILLYSESLEYGEYRVKFIIVAPDEIEAGQLKNSNYSHVEFITKPLHNREFLLLIEKTILLEKYKNLLTALSKESEIRMEFFESAFSPGKGADFDENVSKEAFLKMIDFEKRLMEEQMQLNETIRRIALLRNRDYLLLKERVEAEEMLDELRRNELLDANRVIVAQEALIDYSTKELYDAKKIINASETVAELSRVEALELHNELTRIQSENIELRNRITALTSENMELKKRH